MSSGREWAARVVLALLVLWTAAVFASAWHDRAGLLRSWRGEWFYTSYEEDQVRGAQRGR